MDLLGSMRDEAGLTPSVATYNVVVEALAKAGEWQRSLGMLEKMKLEGTRPTEFTYTVCMSGTLRRPVLDGSSNWVFAFGLASRGPVHLLKIAPLPWVCHDWCHASFVRVFGDLRCPMEHAHNRRCVSLPPCLSVREEWPVGANAVSVVGYAGAGGPRARQLRLQHRDDGVLEGGESD